MFNLDKVVQKSFTEYHSKRNFVERVHAVENEALSKHGPFNSHQVHGHAKTGSPEHKENMLAMAKDIERCLNSGVIYNKQPLHAFPSIKEGDFVFDDEVQLKRFLSLSDTRKVEVDSMAYGMKRTKLLEHLCAIWELNADFASTYYDDYKAVCGGMIERKRDTNRRHCLTVYKVKYTIAVYNYGSDWEGKTEDLIERQPVPDYVRWFETGDELHYLPYEKRKRLPTGPWDNCEGPFLPTKVLELCCKVFPNPPSDLNEDIAILAWVPTPEVKLFYQKVEEKTALALEKDRERLTWSRHALYRRNSKVDLIKMCKDKGLEVSGSKNELVKAIAKHAGQCTPSRPSLYDGKLDTAPVGTRALAKLSVSELRDILHHHEFYCLESKDEMVLRVAAIQNERFDVAFYREMEGIEDLVTMTEVASYQTLSRRRAQFLYNTKTPERVWDHTAYRLCY